MVMLIDHWLQTVVRSCDLGTPVRYSHLKQTPAKSFPLCNGRKSILIGFFNEPILKRVFHYQQARKSSNNLCQLQLPQTMALSPVNVFPIAVISNGVQPRGTKRPHSSPFGWLIPSICMSASSRTFLFPFYKYGRRNTQPQSS